MLLFRPKPSGMPIEDICGHLEYRIIDSRILGDYAMKSRLVELCKLTERKEFKLIYRASRDGFEAASFHAKCDDQPSTLTIIQTTKECVFGAYTSVAWDTSNTSKTDPNAFIFSLVNAQSIPQFFPVKVGDQYSIYCDVEFDGCDIQISDNSNTSEASYSNLGYSYDFSLFQCDTIEAQSFLAGSPHFQTCEIEVFQLS